MARSQKNIYFYLRCTVTVKNTKEPDMKIDFFLVRACDSQEHETREGGTTYYSKYMRVC